MKSKLRELLDKTYELEGLIHLALKREESLDDFIRLIEKKGRDVAHACSNINDESSSSLMETDQYEPAKVSSPCNPKQEEEFSQENLINEEDRNKGDIKSESEEPFSLDSISDYSLEEEFQNCSIAPYIFDENQTPDFPSNLDIKDDSSEIIKNVPRGKLVFSINERFRFRKELFDNSDADFNNTLALVASMENYEEAEDFFINEEGFEISNPIVKEFMSIIKKYFK